MKKDNLYLLLPSSQLFPLVKTTQSIELIDDAHKLASKAYEAVLSKDYTLALEMYNEAISSYDSVPFFYACRSIIHKLLDDDESAFYDYQIAKRYDFNYHNFLEWLENKGNMEEAEELTELNEKISKENANPQHYINRALLQVQHFNYLEAIHDYEVAYDLTNNAEILVSLAAVQMRVLQYDQALKNLNIAINANTELVSAYVYRGKLFAAIRCDEEALNDFNTSFDLSKADTSVLEERASFFEMTGNWDAAIADYSLIIRQNPDDFYTYVLRADLYEKQNSLDLALIDYNKAIELNPYYSDLYQYRGDVKQRLGDDQGAEDDFSKFEELEEDY